MSRIPRHIADGVLYAVISCTCRAPLGTLVVVWLALSGIVACRTAAPVVDGPALAPAYDNDNIVRPTSGAGYWRHTGHSSKESRRDRRGADTAVHAFVHAAVIKISSGSRILVPKPAGSASLIVRTRHPRDPPLPEILI